MNTLVCGKCDKQFPADQDTGEDPPLCTPCYFENNFPDANLTVPVLLFGNLTYALKSLIDAMEGEGYTVAGKYHRLAKLAEAQMGKWEEGQS